MSAVVPVLERAGGSVIDIVADHAASALRNLARMRLNPARCVQMPKKAGPRGDPAIETEQAKPLAPLGGGDHLQARKVSRT